MERLNTRQALDGDEVEGPAVKAVASEGVIPMAFSNEATAEIGDEMKATADVSRDLTLQSTRARD